MNILLFPTIATTAVSAPTTLAVLRWTGRERSEETKTTNQPNVSTIKGTPTTIASARSINHFNGGQPKHWWLWVPGDIVEVEFLF